MTVFGSDGLQEARAISQTKTIRRILSLFLGWPKILIDPTSASMYTSGMNTRQYRLSTNLRRLMAKFDLDTPQIVEACGVDERTVRGILNGACRPHQNTLAKLAEGLGVDLAELTMDPNGAIIFDRATNPIVREVLESHWDAEFAFWPDEEIDELFSRMGVGGPLTVEGVLEIARLINERRAYIEKFKLLFETPSQNMLKGMIDCMYAEATHQQLQTSAEPAPPLKIAAGS